MKKFISVLLAAIMLISCFSIASFAAVELTDGKCTCSEKGTHNPNGSCHCCIFCPNINVSYVTECAKATLDSDVKIVCCYDCTGIVGCNCGCSCCELGEDLDDDNSTLDDVWTDQDQQNFVDGFQAILKTISDFFDKLFDTIFEFLGIEDVLNSQGANPEK